MDSRLVTKWFSVREIRPGVYFVSEPAEAGFYILPCGEEALFIDSGLGLTEALGQALLDHFGIRRFDVLLTHTHADHCGMNGRARSVALHEREWRKFLRQNEGAQIAAYHSLLGNAVPWPPGITGSPRQAPWQPSRFLEDGELVSLGSSRLRAFLMPGHTAGHMIYFHEDWNLLFLGDLVYEGALYLHFPDSSLAQYAKSLDRLGDLIRTRHPLLLPSHNAVPLDEGWVSRARGVIEEICKGRLEAVGKEPGNQVFGSSQRFESMGMTVNVLDVTG